jgi:hypothetical protein
MNRLGQSWDTKKEHRGAHQEHLGRLWDTQVSQEHNFSFCSSSDREGNDLI